MNKTLEAMANAMIARRGGGGRIQATEWLDAVADARAALRALAACERDEARRAMLAELVEEAERDG